MYVVYVIYVVYIYIYIYKLMLILLLIVIIIMIMIMIIMIIHISVKASEAGALRSGQIVWCRGPCSQFSKFHLGKWAQPLGDLNFQRAF